MGSKTLEKDRNISGTFSQNIWRKSLGSCFLSIQLTFDQKSDTIEEFNANQSASFTTPVKIIHRKEGWKTRLNYMVVIQPIAFKLQQSNFLGNFKL